ncbi:hypothetical protein ACHQM5_005675 [Ranunculus cassubicifolius]
MGLSRFTCLTKSLNKSTTTFPNPKSLKNPIRHVPNLRAYHSSPLHPSPKINLHGNQSFLLKTQFNLAYKMIHTDTKEQNCEDTNTAKLCKILSNHNGDVSNIEKFLNCSGVSIVSPELVEGVLKKLSNSGALALSFFRWAEKKQGFKHSTECYNALVEALGKIKQFKLIWSLVDEMKGKGLLTKDTFALIMRRYAKGRKINEAIETFKKMEKYGMILEGSDYNRLIDTLSKSGHVKVAQQVFDEMKRKKFSPDVKTYTILLEGWGDERNILMVEEVLREMKDEGFQPDVVTYGIVINAYCKSSKYEEAFRVVREMEAKKCKLSPHIYCMLVNALGGAKRLDEAIAVFNKSKAAGFPTEIPTYNALVGSYCWSSRFEDAAKVMDEMKQCGVGPNSRTYEIILHHLIRTRRTTNAHSLFEKMESDVDCQPTLNTYVMMIKMFCDEERVDMAVKIWNTMKSKGILPSMHVFSSLITGLCKVNKLDEACKYIEEMLDVGLRPPGKVYSNLKEALLEAEKEDVANSLDLKLERARKTSLAE